MFSKGYKFFLSENGVWLTDQVPAEYVAPINNAQS
jgi:RNA:NAD 2'-phosphotransferase (TPT1/KptA family)